jgi:hypothetical protein
LRQVTASAPLAHLLATLRIVSSLQGAEQRAAVLYSSTDQNSSRCANQGTHSSKQTPQHQKHDIWQLHHEESRLGDYTQVCESPPKTRGCLRPTQHAGSVLVTVKLSVEFPAPAPRSKGSLFPQPHHRPTPSHHQPVSSTTTAAHQQRVTAIALNVSTRYFAILHAPYASTPHRATPARRELWRTSRTHPLLRMSPSRSNRLRSQQSLSQRLPSPRPSRLRAE